MDFSTLDDEIAEVAHRCWCKRMLAAGWRPGKLTDRDAMIHDGLRSYAELTDGDRSQLRVCIRAHEMEEQLAASVRNELTERVLAADDLYVGMRVRMVGDPNDDIGVVESWSMAASDPLLLESIVVRWPNGEVVDYCPAEHAIEPVED